MFDKMKQLMEVKSQMEKIKRELEAAILEISDIRGIKITVNGAQNFKAIQIDPLLLGESNKQKLEGDLLRAVNIAVVRSQNVAAQKMKAATGLNIPGL
ncbi:MAG: YbaB/EbfC family nucleoid-associated protein [Candidatus Omnitrophota bacterium]